MDDCCASLRFQIDVLEKQRQRLKQERAEVIKERDDALQEIRDTMGVVERAHASVTRVREQMAECGECLARRTAKAEAADW